MKHLIITLFLVACCVSTASAITYQVGPSRTYKKLQDVATLLAPGDLVEVDGNATALAVGTASPRPVFGAIDIGAYEWTP